LGKNLRIVNRSEMHQKCEQEKGKQQDVRKEETASGRELAGRLKTIHHEYSKSEMTPRKLMNALRT